MLGQVGKRVVLRAHRMVQRARGRPVVERAVQQAAVVGEEHETERVHAVEVDLIVVVVVGDGEQVRLEDARTVEVVAHVEEQLLRERAPRLSAHVVRYGDVPRRHAAAALRGRGEGPVVGGGVGLRVAAGQRLRVELEKVDAALLRGEREGRVAGAARPGRAARLACDAADKAGGAVVGRRLAAHVVDGHAVVARTLEVGVGMRVARAGAVLLLLHPVGVAHHDVAPVERSQLGVGKARAHLRVRELGHGVLDARAERDRLALLHVRVQLGQAALAGGRGIVALGVGAVAAVGHEILRALGMGGRSRCAREGERAQDG